MSITKDEIAAVLNARLSRGETAATLLEQIRSALYDLSELGNWPDMATSDTAQTLASGSTTLSYPTGFRSLVAIVLNDGSNDGRPLELLEGGYLEWLRRREDESSGDYDEPEFYTDHAKKFYVEPIADDDYTTVIDYFRTHPHEDTILFGEEFREAIYNAVMMKYLEGLGLSDSPKYGGAVAVYQRELVKLSPRIRKTPVVVKYRDI